MDVLVLVGRILFVVLLFGSAVGHLTQTAAMTGYAESKKVPAPKLMVQASGVLLLIAALSLLLGIWPDVGALLVLVFMLPTAVVMHGFWSETDPGTRANEMLMFQKDLALAGAALMLFAFFAYVGDDLGLTMTGPLFSLS